MKQVNLFGDEFAPKESKYTAKITAPIYEPKNEKPHIMELFDNTKSLRLINEIESSEISEEEKRFLIHATYRHIRFNYTKIADYYAHCGPEMQNLIEKSGLVIIDFEKAIQYNYVKLTEELGKIYLEEYEQ